MNSNHTVLPVTFLPISLEGWGIEYSAISLTIGTIILKYFV